MRSKFSLLTACVSLCFVGVGVGIGCGGGSSDDGDGGSGGGSSNGGKGGSASGGKGGSSSNGGKGGSSDSGGKGGSSSGTGGSSVGGSAGGGSGGSSVGGSAGGAAGSTPQGGSAGTPPAISGSGAFFSGADMTVAKLVSTDAMPGYFYASENAPGGVKVESVTDPALPAGTKYAISATYDSTMPGNYIFGWNWRQNDGMKWNYADISAYKAVSFWAKNESTGPGFVFTGYFMYDSSNFTAASQYGGVCAAEPCSAFPEYAGVTVLKNAGWTRFVRRFADTTGAGIPVLTAVGRIDMLQLRVSAGGVGGKILVTGVQLLKEDELPPM